MPRAIPVPELVGETVDGAVYDIAGKLIVVTGVAPAQLAGKPTMLKGSLTVRYGLPLFTPPAEVIVPGLFVSETGGWLLGNDAWNYIQDNFQVHPRADIVGKKLDGSDVQAFLREVDVSGTVRVFIYETAKATQAMAELSGLYLGEGGSAPELLAKYLPRLAALA